MQVLGTFQAEKRVQKAVDGQFAISWQPRSVSACAHKHRSCMLPACLLLSRPQPRVAPACLSLSRPRRALFFWTPLRQQFLQD